MLLTVGVSGYLYVKIPKGFFPQQDTGRLQGQVQGQQHISYQALVEKAKWFEEQVRADPDVDTVGITAGSNGGGYGGGASAQIFVQLKEKRDTTPDQVIARIRHKTSGMPGRNLVPAVPAGPPHRRPAKQRPVSVHAADTGSRSARQVGPAGSRQALDAAGDRGREFRPAEFRPVLERHHRSRYRFAPRPDRAGGRQRALRRVRPAPGLDDVQVDQPVSCGARARAAVVGEPGFPEQDLRADAERPLGSAIDVRPFHSRASRRCSCRTRASSPPPRFRSIWWMAYSLSDAVLAINKAEIEMGLPTSITGKFAGTAQAFQDSLSQPADPDPDRASGRLHHSRHSLRKPDSSADHHLDAAFGGRRRADRAGAVQDGAVHHCHDRHHSADRHRQEKRHHDDRFRAGRRAHRA